MILKIAPLPKLKQYCAPLSLQDYGILSMYDNDMTFEYFYPSGGIVEISDALTPYLVVEKDLAGDVREHVVMRNLEVPEDLFLISTRILNKDNGNLVGGVQMVCPMGIEQAQVSIYKNEIEYADLRHIKSLLTYKLGARCDDIEPDYDIAEAVLRGSDNVSSRFSIVAEDNVNVNNYRDVISSILYKITEAKCVTKNENKYAIPLIMDQLQSIMFSNYKYDYDVKKGSLQYCADTFNGIPVKKLKMWLKEPIPKYLSRQVSASELEDIGKKLLDGYDIILGPNLKVKNKADRDPEDVDLDIREIYDSLSKCPADSFDFTLIKNKQGGYECNKCLMFKSNGETLNGEEVDKYAAILFKQVFNFFKQNGHDDIDITKLSVIYLDKICYIRADGDKHIAFIINMAFAPMVSPVLLYL